LTHAVAEVALGMHDAVHDSSHEKRIVLQETSAQNLMFPRSDDSYVEYVEGFHTTFCWKGFGVAVEGAAWIASPISSQTSPEGIEPKLTVFAPADETILYSQAWLVEPEGWNPVYPDAYVGVPPVPPKLTPPIRMSLAFVVVTVTDAVVLEAVPPTPLGAFGSKGDAVLAPEIAKTENLMLCAVV
jgi:hypothetical protein